MLKAFAEYKMPKLIDVVSFCSLLYYEFEDDFVDEIECHKSWEMVFVDKGECDIIAGDRTFALRAGEMCFHRPYERHKIRPIKGIHPSVFIISFVTSSPVMEFFEGKKFDLEPECIDVVHKIISEAFSTYDSTGEICVWAGLRLKKEGKLLAGEQTILSRFEILLIELLRRNRDHLDVRNPIGSKDLQNDPLCLRVINYLEAHIFTKVTLEDISQAVSFSRAYISKRFMQMSGHTVMEYLTHLRIQKAKELITNTDMNFNQISDMLIFSNSHHFSSVFRKHTGETPTQYRRRTKSNQTAKPGEDTK